MAGRRASTRDPSFEFFSWADSVQTVELMDSVLASAPNGRPVNVLVELGGPHGRTGARTVESARAVAEAVHRSARLTLAGRRRIRGRAQS